MGLGGGLAAAAAALLSELSEDTSGEALSAARLKGSSSAPK